MKVHKYLFNKVLRRYNKCKRRLDNLKSGNRNLHRQGVLEKHIARMFEKLITLQNYIKRGTVVASLATAAMAFQSNEAQAQSIVPTFTTAVVNPYGLTNNNEGYTAPAFADLDNDGDLDMLSGQHYGDFAYYENTGSNTNPQFSAANTNPFGLTKTSSYYNQLAFADLDHDGDADIMAGDSYGNFYYYENTGTASSPAFANPVTNPFGITPLSGNTRVSFADIDNDGDLDLMASGANWSDNNFYYFENAGTNTTPNFSAAQTNPFGLAQQTGRYLGASLGDIDNDGDFDIISQSDGDFNYYNNSGTNTTPSFDAAVINPFALGNLYSVTHTYNYLSAFVDLNNDGRLDIMTGDELGNFIFNKNTILPGAALSFDGVNDYVDCANILGASYTKEAWINITNLGLSNNIISGDDNLGKHAFWAPSSNSNLLSAGHNGSWFAVQDNTPLLANTWYHVAVTYDATSQTMNLYKNGALVSSNTNVAAYTGGNQAYIGSYNQAQNSFGGNIDEVRIWNRALCQGEIMNNMNGELPMPQTGLAAYYKFNEGQAFQNNTAVTSLADSSGNNHNGTLNNLALSGSVSNWVVPGAVTSGSLAPAFSSLITVSSSTNTVPVGGTATLTANGSGAYTYTWSATAGSSNNNSVVVNPMSTTIYSVQGSYYGCLSNVAFDTVTVSGYGAGAALNFDGVDDKITSSMTLNGLSGTWEAWIQKTDWSDEHDDRLFGNGINFTADSAFYVSLHPSAGFHFRYGGNGQTGNNYVGSTATQGLAANSWHHLATTWNYDATSGNTTLSLYLDGTLLNSTVATLTFNINTGTYFIGGGGDPANPYFGTGNMDEVRLWNRALCVTEIQNHADYGELSMPQHGLVAYYKFNEGLAYDNNPTITTLTDSSGNSNTGTLTSFALTGSTSNWVIPGAVTSGSYLSPYTPPIIGISGTNMIPSGVTTTLTVNSNFGLNYYTWSASAGGATTNTVAVNPTTTTVYSVQGADGLGCFSNIVFDTVFVGTFPATALNFDGNDDLVSINTGTNTVTAPYTIEAWVKNNSTSSGGNIFSSRSSGEYTFDMKLNGNYGIHCDFGDGSNWINTSANGNFTPTNNWIHIAFVATTTGYSIYADSVLIGSGTFTGTPLLLDATHNVITIGSVGFGGGENFDGNIDEVRVWNRALCQGEILNNMKAELSLPQTGLVAYYKFNQGNSADNNTTITTLTDASGNAYDGTLNNFALMGANSNWVAPGAVTAGSSTAVFTIPTLTVSGNATVCAGTTTTLTASGATTYTWTTGSVSDTTIVTPSANAIYTVTGSYLGCAPSIVTTSVTVNALPSVLAGVTTSTLCSGTADTLIATGASTYTWSANAGSATTGSLTVSPTANTTYTVTGADLHGCVNTSAVSIVVTTCVPSGIKQIANNSIGIYPNPTTGNFMVESDKELGKISVCDMLGREIYSANVNQTKTIINIDSFVSGVYYVSVLGSKIKIVKQ